MIKSVLIRESICEQRTLHHVTSRVKLKTKHGFFACCRGERSGGDGNVFGSRESRQF